MLEKTKNIILAVIYDLDDTLLDTINPSSKNLVYALTKYPKINDTAVPTPEQAFANHYATTWDGWVKDLIPEIDVDDFKKFYNSLRDELPHNYKPIPGAIGSINFTQQLGPQGIMTSGSKERSHTKAKEAGIDALFDFFHSREDVEHKKPHRLALEPGIQIIESKSINRANIAYIGDRENDYIASINAEIQFIGVRTGARTDEMDRLKNQGKIVLPSVAYVPMYISAHNALVN